VGKVREMKIGDMLRERGILCILCRTHPVFDYCACLEMMERLVGGYTALCFALFMESLDVGAAHANA
jgi:hypothetical protein